MSHLARASRGAVRDRIGRPTRIGFSQTRTLRVKARLARLVLRHLVRGVLLAPLAERLLRLRNLHTSKNTTQVSDLKSSTIARSSPNAHRDRTRQPCAPVRALLDADRKRHAFARSVITYVHHCPTLLTPSHVRPKETSADDARARLVRRPSSGRRDPTTWRPSWSCPITTQGIETH